MADEEHEQPSVADRARDGSVAAPKAKDGFDTQIGSAMQKFTVGWHMVTAAVRDFEDAKTTNAAFKREGDLSFLPLEKSLNADNSGMSAGNAAAVESVDFTPWIYDVEIICTQEENKDYKQSPTPLDTGAAGFATTPALPPRVRKARDMRHCASPVYPPVPLDEPTRRSSRLRTAINKPYDNHGTMVPAPRGGPNLDFGHPPKYKATTMMFPAPRAEPDLDLDCVIRCIYASLPASSEQNGKGQEAYNALVETTGEAFAAARHDGSERQVAWRALASFMQQGHCFFKRSKHGTEKWEQAYDRISLAKFLSCLRYNKHKRDATPMDAATSPLSEYEVRRARNIERNNARLLELGLISEQQESRSNQMAWAKNALGTSPLSDYEVRRARNIQRNNTRLRNLGLISEQEESRSNQMAWTKNLSTGQMN
jgi:hypothetical protein